MALGVDAEFFVAQEGVETIIPALAAFETAQAGGFEGFKEIYKEIIGPDFEGYSSMFVTLDTSQVTEDGAAIETPCNPGGTARAVLSNVTGGVKAANLIAEANYGWLSAQPLVWIDPEHLANRDELRVLGCDPDRNYWKLDVGECKPEQDAEKTLWRTGGGHIHFSPEGIGRPDVQESLVVFCDLLLGTLDVMLENTEEAITRRTMYGGAGSHRLKPYGLEYRVMSNAWFVNPKLSLAVLEVAEMLHNVVEGGAEPWRIVDRVNWQVLIKTINQCDARQAAKIFLYTMECLDKMGYVVSPLSFNLIKAVYKSGGVLPHYSYDMKGWLKA